MDKKAQSGVFFIYTIVLIFVCIILFLGFFHLPVAENIKTDSGVQISLTNLNFFESFIVNFIQNVSKLGWINAIIFIPLLIALIWSIAVFVRGGGN